MSDVVSSLSRADKLRLYDAIQEKKRRLKDSAPVYHPNEGQAPVHRSPALLRCVFSGNGAGKTALAANEALWAAQGYNPETKQLTPVPCKVAVVLDQPVKIEDKWLPELRRWANIPAEWCEKRGKPYISLIRFPNGSTIQFFFHDQEPMVFESIEVNFAVFDEPPPRHCYIGLRRGGREKNKKSRFLIVGTPITQAWLRVEIAEPWAKGLTKDTECFKFGTVVNEKNLADNYIADFSSVLSEKERAIRLQGEFFDLDGLALAHLFRRDTHCVPMPQWSDEYPVVVAIDPHPSKAHVAVMLGADKEGYKYLKELSSKKVAREFAQQLKKWMDGYRVVDIVCDSLGNAEGTGGEGYLTFIQVLKEEGIRVRATTSQEKDDEDWIERIRDVLAIPEAPNNFGKRLPKLQFVETCHGGISDVENVQWVKWKNKDEMKPKLDIGNKDYLAALKYALATSLTVDRRKHKAFYRNTPVSTYGISRKAPATMKIRARRYARA